MEQTAFAKIAYDLVILKTALGNHHLSPLLFVSDDLIPVFFFLVLFSTGGISTRKVKRELKIKWHRREFYLFENHCKYFQNKTVAFGDGIY